MYNNRHMKKVAADPVRLSLYLHRMNRSNLKMSLMTHMVRAGIHHDIRGMMGTDLHHRTSVINSPIRINSCHHHIILRKASPVAPAAHLNHQAAVALRVAMSGRMVVVVTVGVTNQS